MTAQQRSDMRIRIGVLAAIFVGYSSSGLATNYGELANSFPTIPVETIMMLTSVMGLFNMASSLLVGPMQRWLSQKQVLCLGLIITLFGIVPMFYHENFWVLMAIVALIGFGTGMLTGCGPAYISGHFKGEARVQMLGLKMSIQGVGSVAFSLLGGALAVFGWWFTYLPFVLVGIALIMCVIMLPREKTIRAQAAEAESEEASGEVDEETADLARREERGLTLKSPWPVLLIAITCFICMTGAAQAGISLHIEEHGMGNSATTGVVVAILSLGMVFGGIIAPKFISIFKTHTQSVCLGVAVVGLLVWGITTNVVIFAIAGFIWGTVYAIYFGHNLNYLSGILKPSSAPTAMSLNAGISSGCYTIGVPIINSCAGFIGLPSYDAGFFVMAAILGVVFLFVTLTGFEKKLAAHML